MDDHGIQFYKGVFGNIKPFQILNPQLSHFRYAHIDNHIIVKGDQAFARIFMVFQKVHDHPLLFIDMTAGDRRQGSFSKIQCQ